MTERPLFEYNAPEKETPIPSRPLGEISNFVIEQLPTRLEEILEGTGNIQSLIRDTELMIAGLRYVDLDQTLVDAHAWDLASYDLKLIDVGITQLARLVHANTTPPENLVTTVDAFAKATDQPPTVTYEDLIFVNPAHDRRTFTRGQVGQSEADFYEGHRRIENYMEKILENFTRAIKVLSQQGKLGVDKATFILKEALADFLPVISYTDIIGLKMNKNDFSLFREYFRGNLLRGTPGASGAFSSTIPTFDLLLGGENLPEDRWRDLDVHMQYFPRKGRRDIGRAEAMVHLGLTLNSLYQAAGKPEVLGSILQELSHQMHVFRGKHYHAVQHRLPDILSGFDLGTRGETSGFLRSRINTPHIQ